MLNDICNERWEGHQRLNSYIVWIVTGVIYAMMLGGAMYLGRGTPLGSHLAGAMLSGMGIRQGRSRFGFIDRFGGLFIFLLWCVGLYLVFVNYGLDWDPTGLDLPGEKNEDYFPILAFTWLGVSTLMLFGYMFYAFTKKSKYNIQ
jgi:hypothetical protein